MNKIILIGRMGADPDEKKTNFWTGNIATSETWTDKKTGERKTSTDWHTLNFGEHFKGVIPYIKKGGQIMIEGKQRHVKKDDKYYSYVQVESVELLGSKTEANSGGHNQTPPPSTNPSDAMPPSGNYPDDAAFSKGNEIDNGDDLPF